MDSKRCTTHQLGNSGLTEQALAFSSETQQPVWKASVKIRGDYAQCMSVIRIVNHYVPGTFFFNAVIVCKVIHPLLNNKEDSLDFSLANQRWVAKH